MHSAEKRGAAAAGCIRGQRNKGHSLKGPALAEQLYCDITLRSYMDLDIIVLKKDLVRAKELLSKEGYSPEIDEGSSKLEDSSLKS